MACIIALCRYGGLRYPSEVLGLTWDDVLWDQDRMIVRAPKTEHHEDRGIRQVPLFAELRVYLAAAFDVAPPPDLEEAEDIPF